MDKLKSSDQVKYIMSRYHAKYSGKASLRILNGKEKFFRGQVCNDCLHDHF